MLPLHIVYMALQPGTPWTGYSCNAIPCSRQRSTFTLVSQTLVSEHLVMTGADSSNTKAPQPEQRPEVQGDSSVPQRRPEERNRQVVPASLPASSHPLSSHAPSRALSVASGRVNKNLKGRSAASDSNPRVKPFDGAAQTLMKSISPASYATQVQAYAYYTAPKERGFPVESLPLSFLADSNHFGRGKLNPAFAPNGGFQPFQVDMYDAVFRAVKFASCTVGPQALSPSILSVH